jgi:hypothetical protein
LGHSCPDLWPPLPSLSVAEHGDRGTRSVDVVRAEYERLLGTYDYGAAAMAALEVALVLYRDGLVDEARVAYHEALAFGAPEVIAEARRRAGWASPAEQAYDLVLDEQRDAAVTLLTAVYEPSKVGEFFLAVCGRNFDEAADMVHGMGGDLEISDAGRIAIDMAGRYLRDGDDVAATEVIALVAATDFTSEQWEYALDSGSFANSRIAAEAGVALLQLTLENGDVDRATAIVERSEACHPEVAVTGHRLLARWREGRVP